MDKDLLKKSGENADKICSSIRDESGKEAKLLLDKAHKERDRILSEASQEARNKTSVIVSAAEKEITREKEKASSNVTMEKRRVSLEAKSLFIADVIAVVKKRAESFRGSNEYAKFLRAAILEGIKIVDDKRVKVFYSHIDEGMMAQFGDLPAEFEKSDFDEAGVIVQSQDGRLLFDNRFSARLNRAYDEIYMNLLREAF